MAIWVGLEAVKFTKRFGLYWSIGGRSSLYTGERRAKDDRIFSALGAIDELSCQVTLFPKSFVLTKVIMF